MKRLIGLMVALGVALGLTQTALGQIFVPPDSGRGIADVLKEHGDTTYFNGHIDGVGNLQVSWINSDLFVFVDGRWVEPVGAMYEPDRVVMLGARTDQDYLMVEMKLNDMGWVQIEGSDEYGYDGWRITLQAQPERDQCLCKQPQPNVQTDRAIECSNSMCSTGDDCTFMGPRSVTQCYWRQGPRDIIGTPIIVIGAPAGIVIDK